MFEADEEPPHEDSSAFHDELAGAWNEFHDPVGNYQRQSVYANNRRIVRNLNDIDISIETFRSTTLDDLSTLEVPQSVDSVEDKRRLCETFMHIDCAIAQVATERQSGSGATLSGQNITDLDDMRFRLMGVLFSLCRRSETDSFQNSRKHYVFRLDILVFRRYLRCHSCILADAHMQARVAHITPSTFEALVKKNVIPRTLRQKPIVEFTIPDIVFSLKHLEEAWLLLHYNEELSIYLDLLSARFGTIIDIPQPPHVYGAIKNYQKLLPDGSVTYTDRLLEDVCWSLIPMYKKIHYHNILASRSSSGVAISNEVRDAVEHLVTETAFQLENKTLIEVYTKLYTKCSLRPSERAKFRRDYRNKTETHPTIIEKIRGKAAKRLIMEKLARAPWIIMQKKLFERPLRDLLVLLLIDSYVSNTCNVAWFNTFVETNIELLHQTSPLDYCDRHYPIVVQYFNHFGVYYENTLYTHESAAKSFVHWLHLMLQPPFHGKWMGKSLVPLTYDMPNWHVTS